MWWFTIFLATMPSQSQLGHPEYRNPDFCDFMARPMHRPGRVFSYQSFVCLIAKPCHSPVLVLVWDACILLCTCIQSDTNAPVDSYKLTSVKMAKRLWRIAVEHHAFFRQVGLVVRPCLEFWLFRNSTFFIKFRRGSFIMQSYVYRMIRSLCCHILTIWSMSACGVLHELNT